ncbi:MAG TPA: FAD-dependent oxidoreductase [Planctomycetota bacterium]|nr:FAD-dependent oxidoreductase [Planctomycetota bacterium]
MTLSRRSILKNTLAAGALLCAPNLARGEDRPAESHACDVLVYGSTPGGVAAAIEAARNGARVILACPKKNPGGMSASGLCTTDAVRRHLFGGFVTEFVNEVRAWYVKNLGENHPDFKLCHDGWYYEPSVAEAGFRALMQKYESLRFLPENWLSAATVNNGRIEKVRLEGVAGKTIEIKAKTFIDGTYEGDLAAVAGAPCRVARESRQEFGESLAGIHYMDFRSGKEIPTPQSGEASIAIQAFCARSIITTDEEHRVPIQKPATYEQHLQDFLPLLQDFKSGRVKKLGSILAMCPLPRKKVEINGHIEALTSINCPGISWAYPDAGRQMRVELDRFHVDHVAGLMHFLQTEKQVPDEIASEARRYGLHDQEFKDNQHWPWQIYVRQGRRIVGREIITQHNFIVDPKTGRTPQVPHPVAMGEHSFDIHPCHDRRWAHKGFMEGVLWYPSKSKGPAQPGQIPYGALLPKGIDNLLVPVAMSSTHIAMSVLRMEPVWMTTGQVAGLAAANALSSNSNVANIDPDVLPRKLNIKTQP